MLKYKVRGYLFRSTQQDLIHLFICNLHSWGTRGCGTTARTAPSNSQEEEGYLLFYYTRPIK